MRIIFYIILFVLSLMVQKSRAGIIWEYMPNDTTINCGESEHFLNTGQPSATTDCASGGITITHTDVKVQSGSCVTDSVITRTWEVTDACSNFETFDQIITIQDTIGPVTICPTDQVLMAADGVDENILDYIPLASITDPCSDYADLTIVQTPAAGTNLPLGPHTINIEATDLCGNSSDCDFTLWIYDTADMEMDSFPSDTIVSCDHDLDSALLGTGSASTSCPVETIVFDYTDVFISGDCAGNDTIQRLWMATDPCGNTESYEQIIVTEDTEAPFIACTVSDTICNSTNGVNAFLGDYTATAATLDNCSSVTVSQLPAPASIIGIGVIDTWLFATDECGNVDSCSLSVVIGDTSTLNLNQQYEELTFSIYPNPSNGDFVVRVPSGENDFFQIIIFDMLGKKVMEENNLSSGSKHSFHLDDKSGIFIVEILNGKSRLRKRLELH